MAFLVAPQDMADRINIREMEEELIKKGENAVSNNDFVEARKHFDNARKASKQLKSPTKTF